MTRKRADSVGARRVRCRCGQPVIRETVGALDVTADAERLTLAEAVQRAGPNRLAWCLYQRSEWTPQRLRSTSPSGHREDCPHPHVVDHECTGAPPAASRRTRKNTPAVHPGQQQLTL